MLGSLCRFTAFCLFVSAAFDWPALVVDRAGTAALALGFLSLGVGGVRGRALPSLIPPMQVPVRDPRQEVADYAELLRQAQLEAQAAMAVDGSGEGSGKVFGSEGWIGDDREN